MTWYNPKNKRGGINFGKKWDWEKKTEQISTKRRFCEEYGHNGPHIEKGDKYVLDSFHKKILIRKTGMPKTIHWSHVICLRCWKGK